MNTRFEDTSARFKTLTWMIGVGVRRRCLADDPVRPALLSSAAAQRQVTGSRRGQLFVADQVRRLMRLLGLEAIYHKPRLSVGNPEHRVYPICCED